MKPSISEAIIVEGRYDKNTVLQCVDAVVIETHGFGVFTTGETMALIRRLAETRGIVVFTDPDGAGTVIRSHIQSCAGSGRVLHAYVPQLEGREKRKRKASKAGYLGVEGHSPDAIITALRRSGATFLGEQDKKPSGGITKTDMFLLGLSGTEGSADRRSLLQKKLDLPAQMSPNALLDVLNALFTKEEFMSFCTQELPKE